MEAPQIMIHHHDPYGTVVEFFLNPQAMEAVEKAAYNAEIIDCDFDICNMSFKICFKNKEITEPCNELNPAPLLWRRSIDGETRS